jgi:hypothetical protein
VGEGEIGSRGGRRKVDRRRGPGETDGGPIERDRAALALLAAGDRRAAAGELVRVHGGAMREYLRAILRDEDVADDAYSLFWGYPSAPTTPATTT